MSKLRYKFETLTVEGFRDLLKRANISVQQFMYLTGRHFYDIDNFLKQKRNLKWEPMISEIVLLELLARDHARHEHMQAIACEYVVAEPWKDETK